MKDKQIPKILIADDEQDILEILQYNLEKEGFEVKTAKNGLEAVNIANEFEPNLVILDIMMPVLDGVEACRQIRTNPKHNNIYIIMLTARSEEYSEIAAFEAGADDYLTKPIKPRALMSRVASILKRNEKKKSIESPLIEINDLKIDRVSFTVFKNDKKIILPKKEFELLFFLASKPNKVYNRDQLLQYIWGSDVYVLARTVDVHIRKIREKIGEDYIKTVKGVGYKFDLD